MEGRRVVIDVDHYPTALQVCACHLICIVAQDDLCSVTEGLTDVR